MHWKRSGYHREVGINLKRDITVNHCTTVEFSSPDVSTKGLT